MSVHPDSPVAHRTATATARPCELYAYHAPTVTRTQGHHIFPVYLQNRVYGRIVLPDLIWLCGNCHDSTHEWLSWLLGDARHPDPVPPPRARALAQKAFDWYTTATKETPP